MPKAKRNNTILVENISIKKRAYYPDISVEKKIISFVQPLFLTQSHKPFPWNPH